MHTILRDAAHYLNDKSNDEYRDSVTWMKYQPLDVGVGMANITFLQTNAVVEISRCASSQKSAASTPMKATAKPSHRRLS
jgi:hypothetical protein